MERDAPHLIAHLGGHSLAYFFLVFEKLFANAHDAPANGNLGITAHLGNLRIAEIVQSVEQKSLLLGIGAECQNR